MKIQFNQDIEAEVVTSFDEETDEIETEDVLFKKDAIHEADVCDVKGDKVDLQFGNGSMWFGAPLSCFTIVEGQAELDNMKKMVAEVNRESRV